jgi:hypothetical protein
MVWFGVEWCGALVDTIQGMGWNGLDWVDNGFVVRWCFMLLSS